MIEVTDHHPLEEQRIWRERWSFILSSASALHSHSHFHFHFRALTLVRSVPAIKAMAARRLASSLLSRSRAACSPSLSRSVFGGGGS
ncbi:hypothetical protein GW17_00056006 [Ensete ventricosum]|nr:hypothetical protein GW17_00056006 [Ensete ventricosum]